MMSKKIIPVLAFILVFGVGLGAGVLVVKADIFSVQNREIDVLKDKDFKLNIFNLNDPNLITIPVYNLPSTQGHDGMIQVVKVLASGPNPSPNVSQVEVRALNDDVMSFKNNLDTHVTFLSVNQTVILVADSINGVWWEIGGID